MYYTNVARRSAISSAGSEAGLLRTAASSVVRRHTYIIWARNGMSPAYLGPRTRWQSRNLSNISFRALPGVLSGFSRLTILNSITCQAL